MKKRRFARKRKNQFLGKNFSAEILEKCVAFCLIFLICRLLDHLCSAINPVLTTFTSDSPACLACANKGRARRLLLRTDDPAGPDSPRLFLFPIGEIPMADTSTMVLRVAQKRSFGRFIRQSSRAKDTAGVPLTPARFARHRTIFISDTHLGTRGCKAEALADFLAHNDCDTLYLVGDIVDGWQLRRWYWSPAQGQVVAEILRKIDAGASYLARQSRPICAGLCPTVSQASKSCAKPSAETADGRACGAAWRPFRQRDRLANGWPMLATGPMASHCGSTMPCSRSATVSACPIGRCRRGQSTR